jgi:hypothetical protein
VRDFFNPFNHKLNVLDAANPPKSLTEPLRAGFLAASLNAEALTRSRPRRRRKFIYHIVLEFLGLINSQFM